VTEDLIVGLAAVLVLGVGAQWISWRLRQPSILLLLVFGFVAGPLTGKLQPDDLFGDLLMPVVSLSVALILFEGGLSLDLREIRGLRGVLTRIILVGGGITLGLTALAAHLLLGLDKGLSLLLGAVLVVSGPTVIIPILRQVRPNRQIASLLKWEAMVIKTVVVGLLVGAGAAWLLLQLFRRELVPDYLHSPFTLMTTIVAFVASNHLQHESGLVAVTLLGAFLANQTKVQVRHVVEFKENLRVLLLGGLFVLLAARLQREEIAGLGFESVGFLLILLFLVRPLSIFVSTLGSPLSGAERLFLGWMHPRGVVSAAVAAIFALRLSETGHPGAERLVALTFLVIVGTIVVNGLSARPLACRLGLSRPDAQGLLLVGASPWVCRLARLLQDEGIAVQLVDSNWRRTADARLEGLPAWYGDALDEHATDEIELAGLGRVLAVTQNDHVNSLAALHFTDLFGRVNAWQLPAVGDADDPDVRPHHLRGRALWHVDLTPDRILELHEDGWTFKKTLLTEEFGLDDFTALYDDQARLLFVLTKAGRLDIVAAGQPPSVQPGDALITFVPPEKPEPSPAID